MALQSLARAGAWLMLAAIVVLSLVPPAFRPSTPMPHHVEHLGAFFLDGLACGVSFPGHERLLSLAAVAFCAGIELAQLMVLGRHARVSDFIIDAAAACIAIFAGQLLIRMGAAVPANEGHVTGGNPHVNLPDAPARTGAK